MAARFLLLFMLRAKLATRIAVFMLFPFAEKQASWSITLNLSVFRFLIIILISQYRKNNMYAHRFRSVCQFCVDPVTVYFVSPCFCVKTRKFKQTLDQRDFFSHTELGQRYSWVIMSGTGYGVLETYAFHFALHINASF